MTINESIRDWVNENIASAPDLQTTQIVTMGETGDLTPPFLGIYETGADAFVQDNTHLAGVTTYEVTCELQTVPADADQDGTPATLEREMRRQIYDIIGNRDAIEWMTGRNGWTIFDIRSPAATTESDEGRRVSRWILSIVASPT